MGFGFFVVVVLVMVTIAMTKDVDLVSEQYYDNGLHYQDHISTLQRTEATGKGVCVEIEDHDVAIRFPRGTDLSAITGRVAFYRPSSKVRDFVVGLALDSAGVQHIPADRLDRGLWRVQVSWKSGAAEYYTEQPVVMR